MTAPEHMGTLALRHHICEAHDDHDVIERAEVVETWDAPYVEQVHRAMHSRAERIQAIGNAPCAHGGCQQRPVARDPRPTSAPAFYYLCEEHLMEANREMNAAIDEERVIRYWFMRTDFDEERTTVRADSNNYSFPELKAAHPEIAVFFKGDRADQHASFKFHCHEYDLSVSSVLERRVVP